MSDVARRRVLGLLVSTALSPLLAGLPTRGARAAPNDQGIGGTGAAFRTDDDTDRGIGGTGVIGTIRKFGSIVVNGMRIAYAPDATVRIDDRPADVKDLRIGQVVRVAANGRRSALSTQLIEVTSEVVGPIQSLGAKRMVVLGQTITTERIKPTLFAVGDRVAVSGLRRNDGTIVASLIERRQGMEVRVAGPVRVAPDGSLRIGALATSGIDPSLIDRRAHLVGTLEAARFVVASAVAESAQLLPSVSTLSVESYVERTGGGLVLGSGLVVANSNGIDIPAGRSVLAVVTTSVGPNGLSLQRLTAGDRTFVVPSAGGKGAGRGTADPGGTSRDRPSSGAGQGPMDFGRGLGGGGGRPGFGPPGFGGGMGPPGPGGMGGGRR